MTWWQAIVLGVVQGATEFLPVSSSGHLIVVQQLLGIAIQGVLFEVAVHVGTLLSVLVVYRARIARLTVGAARREGQAWRYLALLVVATVPAAVIGLGFEASIEALFDAPWVPGVGFLFTGFLLWSSRAALRRDPDREPGPREAVLMGLAQAVALVPGVSRSGTTVVMGLWLGIEAREAAAFSFLMAVPAIAGAAILQVPDVMQGASVVPTNTLLIGAAAAAMTGVLAIGTFVLFLQRRAFHHFALYVWAAGVAYLTWLALRA